MEVLTATPVHGWLETVIYGLVGASICVIVAGAVAAALILAIVTWADPVAEDGTVLSQVFVLALLVVAIGMAGLLTGGLLSWLVI